MVDRVVQVPSPHDSQFGRGDQRLARRQERPTLGEFRVGCVAKTLLGGRHIGIEQIEDRFAGLQGWELGRLRPRLD